MITRLLRLTAGASAAIALVIAVAGPASAHARLERSDPTDGTVVAVAPNQVAAEFDESVGVSADSLRVKPHSRRRLRPRCALARES